MQSHGSLAETPLRSLLESAQGERSTGTLTVRDGSGESAALYFLFGHLFHAESNGKAGDDAVISALAWTNGDFDFDAKAKLPADETVKAGIPDLVHAADAEPKPTQPKAAAARRLPRLRPRARRPSAANMRRSETNPQQKLKRRSTLRNRVVA